MAKTKIEWTDRTWNPVGGCTVTSPGCTNCYAMKMAHRITKMQPESHYQGTVTKVKGKAVWTGKITAASESVWLKPLKRKKPTSYFVNSMGDLFHPNVPDRMIDKTFAIMALSPQHTFQVLTKHPDRMWEYLGRTAIAVPLAETALLIVLQELEKNEKSQVGADIIMTGDIPHLALWPLPNVLLGVSVEDQKRADERREPLHELSCRGWQTFVSYEPALGLVKWGQYSFIDWLICGGESGPYARAMPPDWARAAREFCKYYGIPFFFKQWGEWAPWEPDDAPFFRSQTGQYVDSHIAPWLDKDGESLYDDPQCQKWDVDWEPDLVIYERIGKKAAGRHLDGRVHDGMPSVLMGDPD